jgi:hypothetical protein
MNANKIVVFLLRAPKLIHYLYVKNTNRQIVSTFYYADSFIMLSTFSCITSPLRFLNYLCKNIVHLNHIDGKLY